ncbi:uncharacterized protein G2W53_001564 [Senna tora]|uniref:Uncharacterized protein n=1 Tax=Senna tora TaxID=362788 RepID=A0A834XG53_9FABA|nr:uncharacterized protein G2W53_001564 [Senna tora]
MARTSRRRIASCRASLRGQSPCELVSSPYAFTSLNSRVLATNSPMAIDRGSLRTFIDNCPTVDLELVTYESVVYHLEEGDQALWIHYGEGIVIHDLLDRIWNARCRIADTSALTFVAYIFIENTSKFAFCVASHPFTMYLLGHDEVEFLFFTYVARVMGVIPPFSNFVMSFLNCINVCPIQLVPNVWVHLRGFEESYISWEGFTLFASFLLLFSCPLSRGRRSVFRPVTTIDLSSLSDSERDVMALLSQHQQDMGNLDASWTYVQHIATCDVVVIPSNSLVLARPWELRLVVSKHPPRFQVHDTHLFLLWSSPWLLLVWREASHEGLSLTIKLDAKLLYKALLGLHGLSVVSPSSKRELVSLRAESTRLQEELVAAWQTIQQLDDVLAVKSATMTEMIHTGFNHIDLAEPSSVKKEHVSPSVRGRLLVLDLILAETEKMAIIEMMIKMMGLDPEI